MPILFICFIVFIIWFRVKSKENAKTPTWDESYWRKEREANFARKQDISNLEYIIIDTKRLPFREKCSEEEQEIQNKLREVIKHPLLNLNNMSNTDIKITYGLANFEQLSSCDQNFLLLLRLLNQWGICLYESEHFDLAKQVLEYALDLDSDVSGTYLTLARIYLKEDSLDKIQFLIDRIDSTDSFMKNSIKKQLTQIIREY